MERPICKRILHLLEALKSDHPRRQKKAEELMRGLGISGSLELEISPPDVVDHLPTFHEHTIRELTPMLRARFEYAGSWRRGPEVWLSGFEMVDYMQREEVRQNHAALRENFEGSAPMLFADEQLTLFGATIEVSQDLTYLVWTGEGDESEIWVYEGYESERFANLEEFLRWRLERP